MSNIFLTPAIKKSWHSQNFDFFRLKKFVCRSEIQFPQISLNFKTSCFNLKIRGLGAKHYYFNFERSYEVLKSKSPYLFSFLLNKYTNFSKTKRNRKQKIPHTVLERWTLCFDSYKNLESKVKLWWIGPCERKRGHFLYHIMLKFFNICILSLWIVCRRNFQNIWDKVFKSVWAF